NVTNIAIAAGTAALRFTDFYAPAGNAGSEVDHLSLQPVCSMPCQGTNNTIVSHCRFNNGGIESFYAPLQATNCLFDGFYFYGWQAPNTVFVNCTFHRGTFSPFGSTVQGG